MQPDEQDWWDAWRRGLNRAELPAADRAKLERDMAALRRKGAVTKAEMQAAQKKAEKDAKRRKEIEQQRGGGSSDGSGKSFWQKLWG